MKREVERADHAHHAQRLVAQVLAGSDRARLQIGGHRAANEIEAIEERLDLRLRFAPDLAGLEHDRVGELVSARRKFCLEAIEVRVAFCEGQRGPCGLRRGGYFAASSTAPTVKPVSKTTAPSAAGLRDTRAVPDGGRNSPPM